MIIMGIDASVSSSGWSIFDDIKLNRIDSGCIKSQGDNWRDKIIYEYYAFKKIINKYHPIKIFIEDIPMKDGKSTILKLGAVQGMIISLAAQFNIEIKFLLPNELRSILNLYDGTRQGTHRDILKKKAVEMANQLFGLELLWIKEKSKKNEDDEAEALLIAYSQLKLI